MSNLTIAAIYAPFAVITCLIFSIDLFRRFKRHEHHLFTLLCLCAVCWYACNIGNLFVTTAFWAGYLHSFILIFVGLIPPLLLLFVLEFYRASDKLSHRAKQALFIIPTINAVVALTSPWHEWMYKQLTIISVAPVREATMSYGPWFWVHTVYSYIISATIIAVILYHHFHIARFYRIPSTMMVIGISITLIGNVITLSQQVLPVALDPTLITMSLSLVFFDFAIINNNSSKFVRFSRGQVFHYLHEYILVLDENGRIVDHNRSAEEWFASKHIALSSVRFDDLLDDLLKIGEIVNPADGDREDMDIRLCDDVFPVVLNLRMEQVIDIRGDEIGTIVVCTDVTENRGLIEQLEAIAGMDSLTSLPNHMAYTGARARLDQAEHLPLSVIVADANNLKTVNDTMGHQYGDTLLKVIAEILREVCPTGGVVARTGGDEFIYLLRKTDETQALALMDEIRRALAASTKAPFPVSVSLGCATKYEDHEDLDGVIALADAHMYEDKKRFKAQAGQAVPRS